MGGEENSENKLAAKCMQQNSTGLTQQTWRSWRRWNHVYPNPEQSVYTCISTCIDHTRCVTRPRRLGLFSQTTITAQLHALAKPETVSFISFLPPGPYSLMPTQVAFTVTSSITSICQT